jgi:hypothetical protein
MKIKLRNISGVDKSIQLDVCNYIVVKHGEVAEREVKSENHIPDGWEVVDTKTAPATGKKVTGKPPVVITESITAPIADNSNVTTSAALKGII